MSAAAPHLYVHVPFCGHRCGYCDFVTVTGNEHLQARYVDALVAEIGQVEGPIQTVFIGGGTPTLWPMSRSRGCWQACHAQPRSPSSAIPKPSPPQRLKS